MKISGIIDDIEDPEMRETVAKLQLRYWAECTDAAVRAHPNWEALDDGTFRWLGGRTGPRTPRTLLNWFLANHGDECDQIRDRIVASLRFRESVPEGEPH